MLLFGLLMKNDHENPDSWMEHNFIMLKNKWEGNPRTFLAFRNAAHLKFQPVLVKEIMIFVNFKFSKKLPYSVVC